MSFEEWIRNECKDGDDLKLRKTVDTAGDKVAYANSIINKRTGKIFIYEAYTKSKYEHMRDNLIKDAHGNDWYEQKDMCVAVELKVDYQLRPYITPRELEAVKFNIEIENLG